MFGNGWERRGSLGIGEVKRTVGKVSGYCFSSGRLPLGERVEGYLEFGSLVSKRQFPPWAAMIRGTPRSARRARRTSPGFSVRSEVLYLTLSWACPARCGGGEIWAEVEAILESRDVSRW